MKEKQEEQPAVEEAILPDPGFLKQYRECYPGIKHFHVTGDNLVFLKETMNRPYPISDRSGKAN